MRYVSKSIYVLKKASIESNTQPIYITHNCSISRRAKCRGGYARIRPQNAPIFEEKGQAELAWATVNKIANCNKNTANNQIAIIWGRVRIFSVLYVHV